MMDYGYSARPTTQEVNEHDKIIRDCLAGAERMHNSATQYVRKPDMMKQGDWNRYLKGAAYQNIPAHTLKTWAGAVNRREHVITCPAKVEFKLGYQSLNLDDLAKYTMGQVLSMGRVCYLVEPGATIADMARIVTYAPENEIRIHEVDGKIMEAKFQNGLDEVLCLYINADGHAMFKYMDNAGVITREGYYVIQGQYITYLPLITINAWDLDVARSLSPLYDICKQSICLWDLQLSHSSAMWLASQPQPYVTGIASEKEIPTSLGSSHIWAFASPDSKIGFATYQGSCMADRMESIRAVQDGMAAMGAYMMLSRSGDRYTSGTAKEMTNKGSTADLVEIISNVNRGLELVLHLVCDFAKADHNAVKVAINKDLLDSTVESNWIRALNESYSLGLLSFRGWHATMRANEVLPESIRVEDEEDLVKDDETVFGRKLADRTIDGPVGGDDNDDANTA